MVERTLALTNNSPKPEAGLPRRPLLRPLLKTMPDLPAYTMLLGICEDGLPLLLDLETPEAGSVLAVGDAGFANTLYLKVALTSLGLLNTKEQVNVHLISSQQEVMDSLQKMPHMGITFEPDLPNSLTLVEELANLVEYRRERGMQAPVHVLGIDSLDILIKQANEYQQRLLTWLIEMGPSLGVWVIANIESKACRRDHLPILKAFRTSVVTKSSRPKMIEAIVGWTNPEIETIRFGGQALVQVDDEVLKLWIPRLAEDEDFYLSLYSNQS